MKSELLDIGSVIVDKNTTLFEYFHEGKNFCFELHPNVAAPNTYSFFLLDNLHVKSGINVAEIGAGTGFISILLASLWDDIKITATDINIDAVKIIEKNSLSNNVTSKLTISDGSVTENIQNQTYDLIFSQPRQTPTPKKDIRKLTQHSKDFYNNTSGGLDGLEFINLLITESSKILRPGGKLQFVIVDYLNIDRIFNLMKSVGLIPEISNRVKTVLSPMTKFYRKYIENDLNHGFKRNEHGDEFMQLLIITGQKQL